MPTASHNADGAYKHESVERALRHLANAQKIVDSLPGSASVGARIQEAVDALEELRREQG